MDGILPQDYPADFQIEVKNETGRLRPDQERFAVWLSTKPVLYGVARSVEDALKIIEGD